MGARDARPRSVRTRIRRWWWGNEARTADVLPLHSPLSRVGALLVFVCASLVIGTAWLLNTDTVGWLRASASEVVAALAALAALALPWRRVPSWLLLIFPLIALLPIALLIDTTGQYATAYNNVFTLAAAYSGLTQRRWIALLTIPGMLPLYYLANGGTSAGFYIRLPVALVTWTVLAALLSDLVARYRAAGLQLRREADEVGRLAVQDALTGLPNRKVFEERLTLALERSRNAQTLCAVFFCDIDGFKEINDGLGHAAGDRMLREVANLLTGLLRAEDTVSRLGGDEFALLVSDVAEAGQAELLGHRLAAALDRSYLSSEQQVSASMSVGVAVADSAALHGMGEYPPVSAAGAPVTAARVIAAADLAMYEAKQAGGGVCRAWDAGSASAQEDRYRISSDLRRTLERKSDAQLWVAYQPIVDLMTGQTVGVEALARWDHPARGAVPPELFIAAAEASGVIHALGRRVLQQASQQVARWNESRVQEGHSPLWVSVNCSPKQLQGPSIVEDVQAALLESGLAPERLILEITESALLVGPSLVAERLAALRNCGVVIALDDFGTGYSALSHLRHLPIQIVKIDRSFVAGLGSISADEAVVAAVTGLASRLGQTVLAEGVETRVQESRARQLGCTFGQGNLYAEPQPAADLDRVLVR
ncbi:bifunctional diguanylate cyclase/phosphodiesterase [Jatrophihabitans telluris]|uniref:Bifunctional diguanylate cyclase/phosphodiesterase n=1 Tax=Jatrophihabitans telluris TaxID=2038343 RepID=A0ABY4R0K2_9ACTN|nr:bifunctional diguanylate cyclase/phosphodiesterase [Jatrophihabitans telluris]UQX88651.1 bifunctional diguanylate cyclase/phosphodiesterase [Jatrophihabitans telluris]